MTHMSELGAKKDGPLCMPLYVIDPLLLRRAEMVKHWLLLKELLWTQTEASFKEACTLGAKLCAYGLDDVENPPSSESLVAWAQMDKWSNIISRTQATTELWKILKMGGALRRLNLLYDADRVSATDQRYCRFPVLHFACGHGSIDAVQILVQYPELDVNVQCQPLGECALLYCLRVGGNVIDCFQHLLFMRLLDVDLERDGKAISTAVNTAKEKKFKALWTAALLYLRKDYYPTVHHILLPLFLSITPIAHLVITLLMPNFFLFDNN